MTFFTGSFLHYFDNSSSSTIVPMTYFIHPIFVDCYHYSTKIQLAPSPHQGGAWGETEMFEIDT